jgi:hypothetical protein
MKNIRLITIVITVLLIASCNKAPNYSKMSVEELNKVRTEYLNEKSYAIADSYIDYSTKEDTILPVYALPESRSLSKEIDTLIEARAAYDRAFYQVLEYLHTIEGWDEIMAETDSLKRFEEDSYQRVFDIYNRLQETDTVYVELRKNAQNKLNANNRLILKYVIDDFKTREVELPSDWINEKVLEELIQYPAVITIEEEIKLIDEALALKKETE